ncbi:MAG: AAA family ATPase [Pseudomonadota bacterium]
MSSLQEFVEATKIAPRFFFRGGEAERAVREIVTALDTDAEIVVFTGEPGVGKTFALTQLSAIVTDKAAVASVFFTRLDFDSFLQVVCAKFGGRGGEHPGAALRRRLRALKARGETAILILDDAEGLDEDSLSKLLVEARDPITNEMLMRLVLAGSTTLEHRLQAPENTALAEKIGAWIRLHPMPAEEARAFISEWLQAAGDLSIDVLEPSGLDRLVLRGQGNPRHLNALCLQILHTAAKEGHPKITFDIVEGAAQQARIGVAGGPTVPAPDTLLASDQPPPRPPAPLDRRPPPAPPPQVAAEDVVEDRPWTRLIPLGLAAAAVGSALAAFALYLG